jgi:hypothetical protein
MTTPGYFISGKKLEEGNSYLFKVYGMVTLQDDRVYLILEDPYSIRHLLPSWYFNRYGIQQGQTITCIVDKINCTGRVYLEPEHPYYTIGSVYEFQLRTVQRNEQRKKAKLILTDIFENETEVDCPWEFAGAIDNYQYISCTVMGLRKGKPVLALTRVVKEELKMNLASAERESSDVLPKKSM